MVLEAGCQSRSGQGLRAPGEDLIQGSQLLGVLVLGQYSSSPHKAFSLCVCVSKFPLFTPVPLGLGPT